MKLKALIAIPALIVLVARADDVRPPVSPVPSETKEMAPTIKTEVPEKSLVVPPLPVRRQEGIGSKGMDMVNTAEVLARLQRAAKEVRILEVWSLDPSVDSRKEKVKKSALYPFHDNYSIGRAELQGDEAIHKLLLSIIRSIANGPDTNDLCFDPRHGLRIYDQKGFIDVVVCYECLQGVIYDGKNEMWFRTSADAQADFDAVFAQLGLKKAN